MIFDLLNLWSSPPFSNQFHVFLKLHFIYLFLIFISQKKKKLLSFLLNRIEKLLEYELKIMTNRTNSIEKKACSVSYITKDCCMLINSLELTEPKNLSEY